MMDTFSIIIAGSRDLYVDDVRISRELDELLNTHGRPLPSQLEIVSGGAKGIDASGERYSRKVLGQEPKVFPADWDKFGKGAGHIRNEEMARYAARALLFFKGRPSPGTSNMLAWMACLKKPYRVVVI